MNRFRILAGAKNQDLSVDNKGETWLFNLSYDPGFFQYKLTSRKVNKFNYSLDKSKIKCSYLYFFPGNR
ncbi:MAG TPA: hypothetical protein DEG17_26475 [Cyanobacteria bacterium UBA11149]|nr:hypothetical protein [Cyanobacteria bacterium UBA11367]HBE59709.1 hypothetical protein [Cyanobacteria bacterium UBA11366]HBK62895.1 hypothetical protein [Cyanobacteria bacterium UBA11166]HBR76064.1 hypothetical protein [Cyanobacteria bacterium UBA11159]HBS72665.1 hypothetical protein [Cyanobacteria bacterium UBA11153]HBW92315.1 hypothetical protein [Cyanobacteria bacterium UBA11149]HCA96165.1 hypothetical protein [Cyanobacteria bacterium UBA9226]